MCRHLDPDVFSPVRITGSARRQSRPGQGCVPEVPVISQCVNSAIDHGEYRGVPVAATWCWDLSSTISGRQLSRRIVSVGRVSIAGAFPRRCWWWPPTRPGRWPTLGASGFTQRWIGSTGPRSATGYSTGSTHCTPAPFNTAARRGWTCTPRQRGSWHLGTRGRGKTDHRGPDRRRRRFSPGHPTNTRARRC
ncbi:hypothetical protein [Pseudonocardia sp.]|uniref:hypothetical protein n=1 Tax=Pseudonocardia sp. TaxID=60912 RepID=UPI0039C9354A